VECTGAKENDLLYYELEAFAHSQAIGKQEYHSDENNDPSQRAMCLQCRACSSDVHNRGRNTKPTFFDVNASWKDCRPVHTVRLEPRHCPRVYIRAHFLDSALWPSAGCALATILSRFSRRLAPVAVAGYGSSPLRPPIIREAVRDVITDTVYKRQKHPFLSPPATLNPKQKLSVFVQDTLRSPVLASVPFFDQKKVLGLLDRLGTMDEGSRVANDQVLMTIVSACVLQERFRLAA
jgi:hypothetical protein